MTLGSHIDRPRKPRWLRLLRWPIPGLAVLLLSVTLFLLVVATRSRPDAALALAVLAIGLLSLVAAMASVAMLVGSCCAQYSDPEGPLCIRCGYPRLRATTHDLHPCPECGLTPVESIRPSLSWRTSSVIVHSVELVLLLPFAFLCLHAVAMVAALGA